MNNLHLSEDAQNDLAEIKAYIEEELLNPSAALATVSKNLSFYRTYGNEVYVDRILYARRDYMRVLFGDIPTEEMDE